MLHLVGVGFPRQANPAAVKIRGLGANPCVDQHLRGLNVGSLDRYTIPDRTDAGEHLAANFPCVVAATPRVRKFGTGQVNANSVNEFTAHGGQSAAADCKTQDLAQSGSRVIETA